MAKILIVHAHHEPPSFCSSLSRAAAETLAAQGHHVVTSDLYAMNFQPVSDRSNFTTTADSTYLKQQQEEAFATERQGFAPDIEAEIRKLKACDLLIFSFPLWWFSMPAILKGWVDRVFAYQRVYSRGKWYEEGVGRGKRALVLMTTGGGAAKYGPAGLHPSLDDVLAPIHQGIFWFNGFSPLNPFVAWAAAHGSDKDRHAVLASLNERLANVLLEPVIELPRVADFDLETGLDTQSRFMVTIRYSRAWDLHFSSQISAELLDLRRRGKILSFYLASDETKATRWQAFFIMRERNSEAVIAICRGLSLGPYLNFEVTPLSSSFTL